LSSAFDSAGQRCSALRILCVQEDVAPGMLAMLEGAMRELAVGDPRRLATDVGPVIDADARAPLAAHIAKMRAAGKKIVELPLPRETEKGTFVAPTIIDLGGVDGLAALTRETFGPILHVVRWQRDQLPELVDAINASGYGLTHGIHTRIDETVAAILARVHAGNVYVNRNIVGAVVGVQPFGGHRLSGTGPKAGGPLYVRRLTRAAPVATPTAPVVTATAPITLPGPTGESNTLEFHPRGVVGCFAGDERSLTAQARAALALGNTVLLRRDLVSLRVREVLGDRRIVLVDRIEPSAVDAVLLASEPDEARRVRAKFAVAEGAIVPIIVADPAGRYDWARLVVERTVTVNTAAAGGNAALLSLAEDAT
jgi:RHH-type proline utilization regulon transcriptional repressor/proline dehydrogenase/delta 1-pyrroline-5-carboxylate dehydrogenase